MLTSRTEAERPVEEITLGEFSLNLRRRLLLKNGEKIVIFPEGTRNKGDENELLPFHSGAAMMAIRSKTPIVPILIYKKPRFFRCTHIIVGAPIELTEYYDRKLSEEEIAAVDADLRQHMLDMRQAHKEFLESKKKKKSKQA